MISNQTSVLGLRTQIKEIRPRSLYKTPFGCVILLLSNTKGDCLWQENMKPM